MRTIKATRRNLCFLPSAEIAVCSLPAFSKGIYFEALTNVNGESELEKM